MLYIIVIVFVAALLLISTEHITGINRAAVVVFCSVCGWVAYICYGTDFVLAEHPSQYREFLNGGEGDSSIVKTFISENIFINYVGRAAELVLYLLATVTIVQILQANGCFDFFAKWIQDSSAKKMFWKMSLVTFVLSMNINNLTTAMLMLVVMRAMVNEQRYRFYFGCMIVIAANCGGALTVIGDPVGLLYWNAEYVSATTYTLTMLIPVMLVWITPSYMISRRLPGRIHAPADRVMPFKGKDTLMTKWQRVLMLVVGIGGLWLIPSFRSFTKLSPFVAALVVLSVLWIVDEIKNRKIIAIGKNTSNVRMPQAMQYSAVQQMFYISGVVLLVAVVKETGVFNVVPAWIDGNKDNVWVVALAVSLIGSFTDTFAMAEWCSALHPMVNAIGQGSQNSTYWLVTAYTSQM
ncbi:MAG: sodium:proton antiporter, partial [Bacteroidaceae bacterium]|nr:sodium:proton antiporter [Bacteroidaceae bacterium]